MEKEIWKPALFDNSDYMVSNLGRIKSFKKSKKGKIIKPQKHSQGYLGFNPSFNGKQRFVLIHTVVCEAFLGKKPKGLWCVNHKDGVKTNNNIQNLEWVTYSYNNSHAYENNLKIRKSGNLKHSDEFVKLVCEMLTKYRVPHVCRELNLSESFVRAIKAKRIRKDIVEPFEFLELKDSGYNRYNSKLKPKDIEFILDNKMNIEVSKMAEILKVSKTTIYKVINRKSYK